MVVDRIRRHIRFLRVSILLDGRSQWYLNDPSVVNHEMLSWFQHGWNDFRESRLGFSYCSNGAPDIFDDVLDFLHLFNYHYNRDGNFQPV